MEQSNTPAAREQELSACKSYAHRKGDWGYTYTYTYTGHRYYPADPHPGDIHPIDIAHALAHQCRFRGHVREFAHGPAGTGYWNLPYPPLPDPIIPLSPTDAKTLWMARYAILTGGVR